MSGHERYHVNLAGTDICVDCSDRCGFAVSWEVAAGCRHDVRLILANPTPTTARRTIWGKRGSAFAWVVSPAQPGQGCSR